MKKSERKVATGIISRLTLWTRTHPAANGCLQKLG